MMGTVRKSFISFKSQEKVFVKTKRGVMEIKIYKKESYTTYLVDCENFTY